MICWGSWQTGSMMTNTTIRTFSLNRSVVWTFDVTGLMNEFRRKLDALEQLQQSTEDSLCVI
jgi:hypothetical protein